MTLRAHRAVPILLLAAALFPSALASAQDTSPPPTRGHTGAFAGLVCLDALDVRESLAVVRALVERDAEVILEVQSNCYVIIGSSRIARVRAVVTELEARARDRARARRESPGS